MAISIFRTVSRVAKVFQMAFMGATRSNETLSQAQLKDAYRKVLYTKPVVDLAASFIFAGGFEVLCEDEEVAEELKRFWRSNEGELQQAAVEFCLYGNTWLAIEYVDDALRLKVLPPDAVNILPDMEKPWLVKEYEIGQVYDLAQGQVRIKELLAADRWSIERNGQALSSGPNPYGVIPVVQVSATKFSDEQYGTGEIDEALHETLTQYQLTRNKGVKIENYHGGPLTVVRGVKDFEVIKPSVESSAAGDVGFGIALPDKDSDMFFLESKRPTTERIELLKLLYHAVVVQSQTPEFLLGVGMPDSSGATKEQRAPIERKTRRLRTRWADALRQVNGIVLRMLEYHGMRKYSTVTTDIKWGPLFDRDEKQEAETLNTQAQAVTTLAESRIISVKTARKAIGLVEDVDAEEKQVELEEAARRERELGSYGGDEHGHPTEGQETRTDKDAGTGSGRDGLDGRSGREEPATGKEQT